MLFEILIETILRPEYFNFEFFIEFVFKKNYKLLKNLV